jgi:hypothetical protein
VQNAIFFGGMNCSTCALVFNKFLGVLSPSNMTVSSSLLPLYPKCGTMFRLGNKVGSVESIAMSRLLYRDGRSFRTHNPH